MLSILIPTYNYSVSHLIASLGKAMQATDIVFEILCWEDGSHLYLDDNKAICDTVAHAVHHVSNENKGRITSRTLMAKKAQYDWLLFLDADVELKGETFIKNYLSNLNSGYDAIYGGYAYNSIKPDTNFILRWKYGRNYEQVKASVRNKQPYKVIISGNFMIKRDLFLDISSEIKNDGYGYDNVFGALLKLKKIAIFHIDNAVIHNGLDKNSEFLNKVERAVETLHLHHSKNKTISTENSLLEFYKSTKKIGLSKVVSVVFKTLKQPLRKQLLGNNPNMKLLQFYKLGYLCSLSPSKK
jgi:glycosyltransferase involved in cell wall biosynthesis